MGDAERIKRVEEAILTMKEIILRYDERIDTFREDMARSREDFDFKMNAVIDAQIRNDEQIAEQKKSIDKLEISTKKLEVSTKQLEIASRSHLSRIERLEVA